MEVKVNGDMKTVVDGAVVAHLLESLGIAPAQTGVAVAINGELVSRADWAAVRLEAGDAVEVLRAMQGG